MSEISETEIKAMTKEQNYMRGYKDGKSDVLDKISAEIEHEKGKWDYLSSDTCFDIAIGVVKRYEKEAEGKEVDG